MIKPCKLISDRNIFFFFRIVGHVVFKLEGGHGYSVFQTYIDVTTHYVYIRHVLRTAVGLDTPPIKSSRGRYAEQLQPL